MRVRKAKSMSSEAITCRGIVHGRTVEFQSDIGLPEGQVVEATLQPIADSERLPAGEGIRRSAGAWADDAEGLEEFLEWNRQQRKVSRRNLES